MGLSTSWMLSWWPEMSRRHLLRRRKGAVASFPTYHETTDSATNTGLTAHTVTLPGTVNSGDLLIAKLMFNSNRTVTGPGGSWAALSQNSGSPGQSEVWGDIASGSEGASVTFTTNTGVAGAFQVLRFSGTSGALVAGTDYDIAVSSVFSGTSADPPNVTATWGSAKNMFVVLTGYEGDNQLITTYPSGYSNGQDSVSTNGGGGGASVASATKTAEAASDNAGPFTIAATEHGFAYGLVLAPA